MFTFLLFFSFCLVDFGFATDLSRAKSFTDSYVARFSSGGKGPILNLNRFVSDAELNDRYLSSATGKKKADTKTRRLIDAKQITPIEPVVVFPRKELQCLCDWCEKHCDSDEHICDNTAWDCDGEEIVQCGTSRDGTWGCYCDIDIDGRDVCWEDDWCINRPKCKSSNDCLSDEVCITTCCDYSSDKDYRCFKECGNPFPTPEPTMSPTDVCIPNPYGDGNWNCGETHPICGYSLDKNWICICDLDIWGNRVCWQDDWCSNLLTCRGRCPVGYSCVPDTCCGVPKCLKDC